MTFMPSPLLHCSSLPFCCCSPLFFLCSYPYTSSTSIFLANVYLSVYFSLFPFPFSFIHFSSLHSEVQGKKYIYNGHFSHSPHWPFFSPHKRKVRSQESLWRDCCAARTWSSKHDSHLCAWLGAAYHQSWQSVSWITEVGLFCASSTRHTVSSFTTRVSRSIRRKTSQ